MTSKKLSLPSPPAAKPKRFWLVRDEDVSGISGIGYVAEGIEWTNGMATVSWLGTYHSIETVMNIHTIEALHSHGGRTKVVWEDQ